MTKPRSTNQRPPGAQTREPNPEKPLAPKDHYQREKARRAQLSQPDSEAMESAKREYQALLDANAVKGRGGRPKKRPAAAAPDDELSEEEAVDTE